MWVDRRQALKWLGVGAVSPAAASPIISNPLQSRSRFHHGVASGDPLSDRVIIWTRATPPAAERASRVSGGWTVAADPAFRTVVAQGLFETSPARDFTVKIDVGGLQPGRDYWYRFRVGGEASPAGRARTLPKGGVEDLVLVFATCANYQAGLFNAYDAIANLPRLDAVVHLGDYIYEEAADHSAHNQAIGERLGRVLEPDHEAATLADYRARHALYKTDPDLQAAHARAPWICVWDDHECANDCWIGGSPDHRPKADGVWSDRKAAAIRAYYEWMPIREPEQGRAFAAINRTFQFGDLASLIMLETRLTARARQVSYEKDLGFVTEASGRRRPDMTAFRARLNDPARQMLGARQEAWLADEMRASVAAGRPWQVLGNQVVMAEVIAPDVRSALGPWLSAAVVACLPADKAAQADRMEQVFASRAPYNLDAWDGYPAARERLYRICREAGSSPVVLSGDSHAAWANELIDVAGQRIGVEFGVTSVTSPGVNDLVPGLPVNAMLEAANPHVRFVDHGAKGFVRLTLRREEAVAELMALSTVQARPYDLAVQRRYRLRPGSAAPLNEG